MPAYVFASAVGARVLTQSCSQGLANFASARANAAATASGDDDAIPALVETDFEKEAAKKKAAPAADGKAGSKVDEQD